MERAEENLSVEDQLVALQEWRFRGQFVTRTDWPSKRCGNEYAEICGGSSVAASRSQGFEQPLGVVLIVDCFFWL